VRAAAPPRDDDDDDDDDDVGLCKRDFLLPSALGARRARCF